MPSAHEITYLSRGEIEGLGLDADAILSGVIAGLKAQAEGSAQAFPSTFFDAGPKGSAMGNIRGTVESLNLIGVKNVAMFPENYRHGLPSDPGLMILSAYDTGLPKAILDAAIITTIRTAAVTALGAQKFARKEPKVLGHVGVRGISEWSIRLLDEVFDFDEIRLFSAREESRQQAVERFAPSSKAKVVAAGSWEECFDGADLLVEGSGRKSHEVIVNSSIIGPGATLIVYGGYNAFDLDIMDNVDKLFVDRWQEGGGSIGALAPQIEAGRLSAKDVSGLLCDYVASGERGRTNEDDRIVFWHRGMAPCDITLAQQLLDRAGEAGAGIRLPY